MLFRFICLLLGCHLGQALSAQIAPVYSLSAPKNGYGMDFLRFDLNQGTQTLVRHFNVQEMMTGGRGCAYDYDHDRYIGTYTNAHWETAIAAIDVYTGNVVHDFVPRQVQYEGSVYGDGLLYLMNHDSLCRATLWAIDLPNRTEQLIRTYPTQELSMEFGVAGYDRVNDRLYGVDYLGGSSTMRIVTLDPGTGQVLAYFPIANWLINGLFFTQAGFQALGSLSSGDGLYNNLLDVDEQAGTIGLVQSYLATDSFPIRTWGGAFDYQYQRVITVEGVVTGDRTLVALDAVTGNPMTTLVCSTHAITDYISAGEWALPTARPETRENTLQAFPNPTIGPLELKGLHPGNEYAVVDAAGKTVRSGRYDGTRLDLFELSAGGYLLVVHAGAKTQVLTIVKQ